MGEAGVTVCNCRAGAISSSAVLHPLLFSMQGSCQKNQAGTRMAEQHREKQTTALPHEINTENKSNDYSSRSFDGHSTETIFDCQVRDNLPPMCSPLSSR